MEWTKEQRPERLEPMITGKRVKTVAYGIKRASDYTVAAEAYMDALQMKLTAALSEIERLKKVAELHNDSAVEAWKLTRQWQTRCQELEQSVLTQMGELAVGGADKSLTHEFWYQGGRLRSELNDAFVLHPEIFHEAALKQQLDKWDAIAEKYAERFAAPPSGEQAAPVGKTRCPYCGWPDEPKNEADKRCEGCGWPVKDMPAGFHAMDCPAVAPVEVQDIPKGEV